jgi:SAM-dependent methyltransferase
MTFDPLIPAFHSYNENLRKSLLDKAFFIDKINGIANVLDYGCGDGSLLRLLYSMFPEMKFAGVDISAEMIREAKRLSEGLPIYYTKDVNEYPFFPNDTAIVVSSTIHEVYAYGDYDSIRIFWNYVFDHGYAYICVRDMMLDQSIEGLRTGKFDALKVRRKADPGRLADFEARWGSIDVEKNLIHFLMKYRYVENWTREVNENYFPINVQDFMKKVPSNYECIFWDHSPLLFTKNQILKDFGIHMEEPTHVKAIFKLVAE